MANALTHRRQTNSIETGYVLLFADSAERNAHYGEHVWTLETQLPKIDETVIKFAADYYDINLDEAAELVNPDNIVDTAGAWDDSQFVSDLWQSLEPVGYRTNDGAVVLDREAVKLSYSVDAE